MYNDTISIYDYARKAFYCMLTKYVEISFWPGFRERAEATKIINLNNDSTLCVGHVYVQNDKFLNYNKTNTPGRYRNSAFFINFFPQQKKSGNRNLFMTEIYIFFFANTDTKVELYIVHECFQRFLAHLEYYWIRVANHCRTRTKKKTKKKR